MATTYMLHRPVRFQERHFLSKIPKESYYFTMVLPWEVTGAKKKTQYRTKGLTTVAAIGLHIGLLIPTLVMCL